MNIRLIAFTTACVLLLFHAGMDRLFILSALANGITPPPTPTWDWEFIGPLFGVAGYNQLAAGARRVYTRHESPAAPPTAADPSPRDDEHDDPGPAASDGDRS